MDGVSASSSKSEECDDGNVNDGDGCSSTCRVENGMACSGGSLSSVDQCGEVCGDGKKMPREACDDGNREDGDGCMKDCSAVEAGYTCTGV